MREALALVGEEGLENMWKRHQRLHEDLWKGLGELGLEPFVQDPKDRLATVNTIKVCGPNKFTTCAFAPACCIDDFGHIRPQQSTAQWLDELISLPSRPYAGLWPWCSRSHIGQPDEYLAGC